jgi:hypothetical protein
MSYFPGADKCICIMYPCVCCGGPCVLCNMSIKLWTGQLKSFSEHPDAQFVDMYCSYLPFACIPCFAPCILAHVTLKKQERDAKNAKIKEILKLRAEDNPADATKAEFKVELSWTRHWQFTKNSKMLNSRLLR